MPSTITTKTEAHDWAQRQADRAASIGLTLDPAKLVAARASHDAVKGLFR